MNGENNPAACALVDRWLDDWLAGRLDAALTQRVDEHVSRCLRCQRLTAIATDAEAGVGDGLADDALLSAVLNQTTGSPCARAETLLPALADEELDTDSREILQAHLAHCDNCSRLLAALQEARQVLPALAEIEPPLGFAQRVIAVTTTAPAPAWWWRVLARPRASLELAYVATVLLVVLLGNPVGAFYQAEQRASQLAGGVPVAELSGQFGMAGFAQETIGRFVAGVASVVNAVQSEIVARLNQVRDIMRDIETAITNAIVWIAHIDLRQMFGAGQPAQPRGQPAAAKSEPGGRR